MQESGENYLETIYRLQRRNEIVRSIDIARELNYSKPSVSRAVGILKEKSYIEMKENGEIELTQEGEKIARNIYERHEVFTQLLMSTAGVSQEIAEVDACRMEHVISEETFQGVKEFIARIHSKDNK